MLRLLVIIIIPPSHHPFPSRHHLPPLYHFSSSVQTLTAMIIKGGSIALPKPKNAFVDDLDMLMLMLLVEIRQ